MSNLLHRLRTTLFFWNLCAWSGVAAGILISLNTSAAYGQRRGGGGGGADQPAERTDQNSRTAHEQLLAKKTQGVIDVYFEGDSILRRWGATDYPDMLANWNENFHGWNAADFAWGADQIQNILWRLQNGELDDVKPKVIVFQAGTNNVGNSPANDARIEDITRGIQAVVDIFKEKAPDATIILCAIFPRGNAQVIASIDKINANIEKMADGKKIRYLNFNDKMLTEEGLQRANMFADGLHPSLEGYQAWGDALKPILTELLGPPAAEDHAPPATGDPSASGRAPPVVEGPAVEGRADEAGVGAVLRLPMRPRIQLHLRRPLHPQLPRPPRSPRYDSLAIRLLPLVA